MTATHTEGEMQERRKKQEIPWAKLELLSSALLEPADLLLDHSTLGHLIRWGQCSRNQGFGDSLRRGVTEMRKTATNYH